MIKVTTIITKRVRRDYDTNTHPICLIIKIYQILHQLIVIKSATVANEAIQRDSTLSRLIH